MATAVIGTMAIKLSAQTDKFEKDMKKASAKLASVGKAAKKVSAVAAGALVAVGAAAFVAIRAANEQRQAELKLASALKASGKAVDLQAFRDMANALQDATGQGDELTLSQAALLTSFGASKGAIANLLPGIADYAAATGKNAVKATMNLGRALQGEFSLLKTMGLGLSEAEVKTFKLANQQERATIISDKLGKSFGGTAAALSKTAVGAFGRVQGRIGDLIQEFGFLIDMPVAGFFLKFEGVIKRITGFIAGLSKETKQNAVRFGALGVGIIAVSGAIAGLIALAPLIAAIALPFLGVLAVIALVVVAVAGLKTAWDSDLGGIATSTKRLVADVIFEFNELKKSFLKITDSMAEGFATFIAFIKGESPDEAFARIQEVRTAAATGVPGAAAGAAVGGVGEAVSGAVKTGVDTLKAAAKATAKTLKDVMDPALAALGINMDQVGETIKSPLGDGAKGAGDELKKTGEVAKESAKTLQGAIEGTVVEAIGGFVADMGAGGAEAANAMLAAFSVIGPAIQGGGKEMSTAFSGAAKGFEKGGPTGAAIGALTALAVSTEAFQQIMESVNTIFIAVQEVLQQVLEPLGPFIDAIVELALLAFEIFKAMSGFDVALGLLKVVLDIITPVIMFVTESVDKIFNAMKALGGIFVSGLGKLFKFNKVVKFFGDLLGRIAGSLTSVIDKITSKWNAMIEAIARVLGKIPGVGGKLKKFIRRAKIATIEKAAEDVVETPEDGGPGLTDVIPGAIEGIQSMGEAAREVSKQLSNVAQGFRVDLARFQSTVGETGVGGGELLTPDVGTAATPIQINVEVSDVEEFSRKLEELQRSKNSDVFRSSESPSGTFSTPRRGS